MSVCTGAWWPAPPSPQGTAFEPHSATGTPAYIDTGTRLSGTRTRPTARTKKKGGTPTVTQRSQSGPFCFL